MSKLQLMGASSDHYKH